MCIFTLLNSVLISTKYYKKGKDYSKPGSGFLVIAYIQALR